MRHKIIFHHEIFAEIENALSWYDKKRMGLGDELEQKIFETLNSILSNPWLFAKVYKDYRKINLKIFPYSIIYRIKDETIIVLCFHHQKRHPKHWKKRK